MLYYDMDIDSLSLSQIRVIQRLASNATIQLESRVDHGVSQGWDDSAIKDLRDQAKQCFDLWDKCVKALEMADFL